MANTRLAAKFRNLFRPRVAALADALGCDVSEIQKMPHSDLYNTPRGTFRVMTETEAQLAARQASFLLRQARGRTPSVTPPVASQWGRLISDDGEERRSGRYYIYKVVRDTIPPWRAYRRLSAP